jgi:hypothetical protein
MEIPDQVAADMLAFLDAARDVDLRVAQRAGGVGERAMIGRVLLIGLALSGIAGCADGGRDGLTNMFCGMRESACEQRCKERDAESQLACRRACSDSAADKCG